MNDSPLQAYKFDTTPFAGPPLDPNAFRLRKGQDILNPVAIAVWKPSQMSCQPAHLVRKWITSLSETVADPEGKTL